MDPLMLSGGFLSAHPDLRYRLLGQEQLERKRLADAFSFFKRASYYGDKPSQAMVAEMLWKGHGVPQDRPLAYVWMDLAAERGYRPFLVLRERYWNELNETERERAMAIGDEVYARYGDEVAEPRLAAVLRRERRRQTGSRTGFTGNLQVYVPGPGGQMLQIDGSKFYDERYWDPQQYRAWHDSLWMDLRPGRVDVGAVEQVTGSQVPETPPKPDPKPQQQPDPEPHH